MRKFQLILLIISLLLVTTTISAKQRQSSVLQFSSAKQTFLVQLNDQPVTLYQGGIKGLSATHLSKNQQLNPINGQRKLDTTSQATGAYKQYLAQKQSSLVEKISKQLKRRINLKYQYKMVLNGFAIELTPQEAQQLKQLPQIKSIEADRTLKVHTDRGPIFIKAPSAWNGTATGALAKGEGMIVAIIDTGIRADHPSFAEVSPSDGYIHTNPFGSGVFKGYCATNVGFCNDKLIGAYNYVADLTIPEDERQHGTHVASTAAGNRLHFDLGNGNGFDLSGVAPRANIIAYRIAGADGISSSTASVAAIDQAVSDGVDVINYSFGSSAFDPWRSSESVAFRNARAAGIFVATSAANNGPNPGTIGSPADAPWITSVAASTHDRGAFPTKTISNFSGGDTTPPPSINGRSLTGSITAPIVYAGNFSNGDSNPEQCLNPFPAGTFSGQIVVCDRGQIARVQKAKNVAAGGAGGYVLANVSGGATFLADDIYVIPGIHILSTNGDTIRNWLATGSGHSATINGTNGSVAIDPLNADRIASFSSRGENPTVPNVLKPSVSAPGVSILAAGIGEVDYAFLQGTSMASPHIAGAGALIKQLKPSWSPGQIHSAMVTTGVTSMVKENGSTAADPFDMGGGRIVLNRALNAGLLLDETISKFTLANPASGGQPKTLNLPSFSDQACRITCSWTRQVTATSNSSWTASSLSDNGLSISIVPSSFTLNAGASQIINVTANVVSSDNSVLFGQVILTPNDLNLTATAMPLAVKVKNSSLPDQLSFDAQRDSGQKKVANVVAIATTAMTANTLMKPANPQQKTLAKDSDNSSAFDDLTDGVSVELVTVTNVNGAVFAATSNSTATDLDLFVGFDANGDGIAQESETIAKSTSANAEEKVIVTKPQIGNYWILVQNWDGAATGVDSYSYLSGVIGPNDNQGISAIVPSSSNAVTAFDILLNYSQLSASQYFGLVQLGDTNGADHLGVMAFTLNRVADDISISVNPLTVTADTDFTVTVDLSPNSTETRNYSTSIAIPAGITVNSTSLSGGATLSANSVNWDASVNGAATGFTFTAKAATSLVGQTLNFTISHSVDSPNSQPETASAAFSVQAASGGGTGGGTTGGSNNSGGGGSLGWLIPALLLLILTRKNKYQLKKII
ncbi:MAG: S8 family serine peptidase [Enterobacterales bacterium]|nr:S8 family serine peptidase [Enterobacterales bacterium]